MKTASHGTRARVRTFAHANVRIRTHLESQSCESRVGDITNCMRKDVSSSSSPPAARIDDPASPPAEEAGYSCVAR